jgi:hypothetical protein
MENNFEIIEGKEDLGFKRWVKPFQAHIPSVFESIQDVREDGYPKVKEISTKKISYKMDRNDPAYDLPISNLTTIY